MDFRAILHHTDQILCTFLHTTVCLKSIQEKILLACLSGPTIQAVSINYPKILSKKFCPKNLFAILQVFKYLWNFGHVQEKFYVPEVSKKNQIVWGVWIFYG